MSISVEEFTALQTQFLDLKSVNYEYQEREKALKNEVEKLKVEVKKLNDVVQKSKKSAEFNTLTRENETLLRNLELATQQHQEQQDALKANIKSIYQLNNELQAQLDEYKEKEKKMEREAEFIKTLETQQHQESNSNNDLPQLDLSNLQLDSSVLSQIQSQWSSQLQSFIDHNKIVRDQGYSKRVEELEDQLTKLRLSSEEKEQHLQDQLTMWKEKTNIKQQSLSSVNHELEELNLKLKLKNEETLKMEQDFARKKEELEVILEDSRRRMSEYSEKDTEIAQLMEETKTRDQRISELQSELVDLRSEMKNREQQIGKMNEESEGTSSRVSELEERLNAARVAREQSEKQLKETSKKLETFQENSEKLHQENSNLTKQLEQLKTQFTSLETTLKDLQLENQNLVKKEETFQLENEEFKIQVESLKTTNSSLVKEIEEFKLKVEECNKLNHEKDLQINEIQEKVELVKKEKTSEVEKEKEALNKIQLESEEKENQLQACKKQVQDLMKEVDVLKSQVQEYKDSSLQLETQLATLTTSLSDKDQLLDSLHKSIEDSKTELKIQEKKYNRQIKELKDQLVKERKIYEKKESAMGPPPSPRGSLTPLGTPPGSRSSSFSDLRISASVTPVSIPPSPLPVHNGSTTPRAPPMDVTTNALQEEINVLVTQMSDIQAEKWKLEEKVNLCQETINKLKSDNEKKEIIIKNHILSVKVQGRSTPEMDVNKAERVGKGGIMANLFRGSSGNLPADVTQKMSSVLEETLLKNIQLQNDLDVLGKETSKLMEENKMYKKQLEEVKN